MFEHFVFGSSSTMMQTQHDSHPSPTDTTFLSPPYTPNNSSYFSLFQKEELSEIISRFETQSLCADSCARKNTKTWKCWEKDVQAIEEDEEMAQSYIPTTHHTYTHAHTISAPTTLQEQQQAREREIEAAANRRLQRQLNTQLQSSRTHIRDINALVCDMISSSNQCRLFYSPSTSLPQSIPEAQSIPQVQPTSHPHPNPSSIPNPSNTTHISGLVVDTALPPIEADTDSPVEETHTSISIDEATENEMPIDEGFCEDESLFSLPIPSPTYLPSPPYSINSYPSPPHSPLINMRRASTPCGIRKSTSGYNGSAFNGINGVIHARSKDVAMVMAGRTVRSKPRMRRRRVEVERGKGV